MDHDIEWLFEEVYKIKRENTRDVQFLSDWDVKGESPIEFSSLLSQVYNDSSVSSLKYNYAYEQFSLKNQILEFANTDQSLKLLETEITITPSATISLYLCAQALAALDIKRILIITPAYFSTHESFDKAGCHVFYYHLKDDHNLQLDLNEIESLIEQQYIQGIVLTDPVYSAGIEFNLETYTQLSEICNKNDLYFAVDYSLGGLNWNEENMFVLNTDKLKILKKNRKFLFIDTLSKRLLMNGIKFSVIIGDEDIVDRIDRISEIVYGGLSAAQCFLINKLYMKENQWLITLMCKRNIEATKETYRQINSLLLGTQFELAETNSGYFSLINHKKISLQDIDTKEFSLTLLKECNILAICKDRFTYFQENRFGFRINLNKKKEDLIFPIRQCIGIDYSRFYKR
ncbi:MAG: hypothetical protein K0R26_1976 [Bacteroidota bacterium]|jgi:aspartate/methionine/tyrosine aminotransferase|nr:hypothetical protein [Bacteroidota bacterium]